MKKITLVAPFLSVREKEENTNIDIYLNLWKKETSSQK